jgi:hypothetical protein
VVSRTMHKGQVMRKRKHEGEKSRFIWVTVMASRFLHDPHLCSARPHRACLPEDEGSRFGALREEQMI